MPMKIGILTFHHTQNFGALLQALSLQTLLESWGHAVNILDHAVDPAPWWTHWRGHSGHRFSPGERIRGLVHQRKFRGRMDEFRRNFLHLTGPLHDLPRLAAATAPLDAIIAGSDQVWHFSREPRYFLHWEPPFSGRKISYAASCGSDAQPSKDFEEAGRWIRSFDFVSVRDDFSAQLIRKVSGIAPAVVADPSLLVDPRPWVTPSPHPPQDYGLIYLLGSTPAFLTDRRHRKTPWVWISGHGSRIPRPPPADRKCWHASPGEWLGWIQGCRFLLTDSFHGVLYALQFRKPFLFLAEDRFRSPRLEDLSHRYGLDAHRFSPKNQPDEFPLVQPTEAIYSRIRTHVETSLSFLRRATSGVVPREEKTKAKTG